MVEFITVGKGKDRRRVPISGSSPRPELARSRNREKWIQGSDNPRHNGYAREYIFRLYGQEAFNDDRNHTIKAEYLDRAIDHARANHEITWEKRLVRARTLREFRASKNGESRKQEKASRENIRKAEKAWESMSPEEREKARAHERYEFEGVIHNGEVTELTIKQQAHPEDLFRHSSAAPLGNSGFYLS